MKSEFKVETLAAIDENPLYRESDRGCVLICTSDLENNLRDMLKHFFSEASALLSNK